MTIDELPDGGSIAAVETHYDTVVIKLDKDGNEVWEKKFGGQEADVPRDIIYTSNGGQEAVKAVKTTDGGYLLIGDTGSDHYPGIKSHGKIDAWVVKIDKNGKQVWNKTYGGSKVDGVESVVQCDGGFIISGITFSNNGHIEPAKNTKCRGWIFKIDQQGKYLWDRYVDTKTINHITNAIQLTNGDLVVAGCMETYADSIVMRIDKNGQVTWKKRV